MGAEAVGGVQSSSLELNMENGCAALREKQWMYDGNLSSGEEKFAVLYEQRKASKHKKATDHFFYYKRRIFPTILPCWWWSLRWTFTVQFLANEGARKNAKCLYVCVCAGVRWHERADKLSTIIFRQTSWEIPRAKVKQTKNHAENERNREVSASHCQRTICVYAQWHKLVPCTRDGREKGTFGGARKKLLLFS